MKKQIIRDILKVFAVGFTAMMMAALAAFLAYMSAVLFFLIPSISGYYAVLGFFGAILGLAGSLGVVFMCGAWMVRKGKFSR